MKIPQEKQLHKTLYCLPPLMIQHLASVFASSKSLAVAVPILDPSFGKEVERSKVSHRAKDAGPVFADDQNVQIVMKSVAP